MTMYLQIENQIQGMVYKKYLGEVPMGEASVLVQGIDDACYYYELKHFMDIETQPQEPMILGDASYEFQPFEDVEKEFLKIFNQLMAEINTTKLGNPYTVKDKSAKLDVKFKNV